MNGAISAWLPFIVLLLVPASLATAWVAARLNTQGRLNRQEFVLRIGAMFFVFFLARKVMPAAPVGYVTSMLLAFVSTGLVAYWAVSRLRDMGRETRTLAILSGVPLLGTPVVLYLMAASGTRPPA